MVDGVNQETPPGDLLIGITFHFDHNDDDYKDDVDGEEDDEGKVGRSEGSSNEAVLSFPKVIIPSDRAERRRREVRRV